MPPAGTPVALENGMGTAALVMGILQFLCLGTIGSILAIIFGRIGMKKASQGRATNGGVAKAGFWLGIVGLILSVVTIIILVASGVFVAKKASDAIDPANNGRTGLVDGTYAMSGPSTSLRIGDNCSFGGYVVNLDSGDESTSTVTVVGSGDGECGTSTTDVTIVNFTVSGGQAQITGVQ
jgi:hypothetical protein